MGALVEEKAQKTFILSCQVYGLGQKGEEITSHLRSPLSLLPSHDSSPSVLLIRQSVYLMGEDCPL